jgi:1-acyl-sn-glycerol-3-phosphate acyltransferase
MKQARTVVDWIYGCYAWSVFLIVIALAGSLIVLLRKPRYGRPVAQVAARLLFRLGGMALSVQGLERLPHEPHILLLNHTSFFDPLALTALLPARPGYAFVARQQYRRQSVLCPLLKALDLVLLRGRGASHGHANVSLLRLALKRSSNLIVFPEGRILPQEGLGHFHSGAFIAAAAEHVPIVVAGIHGAREALRLGSWLPRRRAIELRIGPVLLPHGKDKAALSRLAEAAHRAMEPLTGETDAAA